MKKLACIMGLCAVGCTVGDDVTDDTNRQSQAAVDSADKATLYTWYNASEGSPRISREL